MRRRSDLDRRLAERAARCGWLVPEALRAEVVATLEAILRDPAAGAREKIGASKALASLHREERESIMLELTVDQHTEVKARMEEIREAIDAVSNGDQSGAGSDGPDAEGPPPIGTDGGAEGGP